jgi:hypothetical protein
LAFIDLPSWSRGSRPYVLLGVLGLNVLRTYPG